MKFILNLILHPVPLRNYTKQYVLDMPIWQQFPLISFCLSQLKMADVLDSIMLIKSL
jgi:hypothetical protein